jgi:hypothetical protein
MIAGRSKQARHSTAAIKVNVGDGPTSTIQRGWLIRIRKGE